ncbi:MAG: hypothetical protein OXI91_01495 [Chloroflexota bacterium]|nr:hypothetical protein [Chloroflexota bacterium]
MYTLSQIHSQVNSLKRKFASELKVLKVFPFAEEFSLDWTCMVADHLPLPDSGDFIRHLASSGFRFHTYTNLFLYLERCRERGDIPDALGILASLFPELPRDRLADILPWDQPPKEYPGWFADRFHQIVRGSLLVFHSMRRFTAPIPRNPQAQAHPAAPNLPGLSDQGHLAAPKPPGPGNNRSSRRRLLRQARKRALASSAHAVPICP